MTTKKINGHTVVIHDSPGELPIERFKVFNQQLLLDNGLGSDAQDWHNTIGRAAAYIDAERTVEAKQLMRNAQQLLAMIISGINPKMNSFAALVQSIDGRQRDDLTETGLKETLAILSKSGLTWNKMIDWLEDVKKKSLPKWRSFSRRLRTIPKTPPPHPS